MSRVRVWRNRYTQVKPGDEVTAIMHPLRDGTRGGAIVALHLPDGRVLRSGGQPNDPIRGRAGVPGL